MATELERGRPKLENQRFKRLECRVSEFEFEKIEKICKKLKISKTEAILRGIDLLINYKPKKYKSFAKSKTENEPGTVYENQSDD